MFRPDKAREGLDALIKLLGQSPAGHATAFKLWWAMYLVEIDHGHIPPGPVRTVVSPTGRAGFLALASDAIDRGDGDDFISICIAAMRWENERVPL